MTLPFTYRLRAAIFQTHWEHHNEHGPVRIVVKVDGLNTIPEEVKDRFREAGGIALDLSRYFPRPISISSEPCVLVVSGLSFGGLRAEVQIPWDEVLAIGFASGPLVAFPSTAAKPKAPEPPPQPRPGVVSLAEFKRRQGLN